MQAKQSLQLINTKLEEKVLQRTALLNEKKDKLESALKILKVTQKQLVEAEKQSALSHLVVGMAHEMNTRLSIILSATSYLPEILGDIRHQVGQGKISKSSLLSGIAIAFESLEMINSNVLKVVELVRQFKRLSVSGARDNVELIELTNWLELVIKLVVDGYASVCPAEIVISVEPRDAKVFIDPKLLVQALEAILYNSFEHGLQHTPDGVIRVNAYTRGQMLTIEVEDNGRGIDEELKSSIFEPFVTTARGLGLNLVYNLVTQGLGGNIIS